MKKPIGMLFAITTFLFCASCSPHHVTIDQHNKWSTHRIASCIRDSQCHEKFVVAHRGLGLGAPENSKAAMRKAAGTVPIIEIDVRYSRDRKIFVLHDTKLDRTTTLSGFVHNKTSEELRAARLKNVETVPQFEELYRITQGKSVLDVDFKENAVEEIADWVAANGSFDDVIFFVNNTGEMQSAAKMKAKYPAMIVMVRVHNVPNDILIIERLFGYLPEIVQTNFPTEDNIDSIHKKGVKVFANALGVEFWIPLLKNCLMHKLIKSGVDLIQSDDPWFVMKNLDQ
ncbi:MAG: hypothetical protein A3C81_00085 [Candidatus Yanofskybacteria bacterium RIFCSPHIGHO2_02_FULL_46_19]|uniref:GP-PDE domain-containing protein n=1 Tax=Candidatus Yanofskybacteria bacterium RIFCSPHIGHO2_02_FULL_46_19 TaxID=1802684 RepID=A0A1F8FS98_9BACT|nr:MAG: hypothetical protein A3C81_00085 [Candidatus Yanofskybacteria bacterium RIFCSPHIGHO2_02_FULL_46_19]